MIATLITVLAILAKVSGQVNVCYRCMENHLNETLFETYWIRERQRLNTSDPVLACLQNLNETIIVDKTLGTDKPKYYVWFDGQEGSNDNRLDPAKVTDFRQYVNDMCGNSEDGGALLVYSMRNYHVWRLRDNTWDAHGLYEHFGYHRDFTPYGIEGRRDDYLRDSDDQSRAAGIGAAETHGAGNLLTRGHMRFPLLSGKPLSPLVMSPFAQLL